MDTHPSAQTPAPFLNGYEKGCMIALGLLHVAIGCFFLPAAVYYIHRTIYTSTAFWADFTTYYAGAHMVRFSPSVLYNYPSYLEFYKTIKPGVPAAWFSYLAPPSLAVALLPLAYLSYGDAFLVVSFINLFLCILIAYESGNLACRLKMNDLKFFMQSLVFGVLVTSNIMAKGQMSLLMCLSFMYVLKYIDQRRPVLCALWLTIPLHIKPHLFIPVVLYLAGCRWWRAVFYIGLFSALVILFTLPFLGSVQVWIDYLNILREYNGVAGEVYYRSMTNVRGILSDIFGIYHYSNELSLICAGIYIAFTLGCFFVPWFGHKKANIISISFFAPLAFFVTTYFQIHDTIILLPLAIIIAGLMHACRKICWMFLCYIVSSYESGFATIWCARVLFVLLIFMTFYLMRRRLVWQPKIPLEEPAI